MILVFRVLFTMVFLLIFSISGNQFDLKGHNNLPVEEFIKELKTPDVVSVYPSLSTKLDSLLDRYHKRTGFSGNVLISSADGNIHYRKAIGYSNLLTRESLHEESIFQLASVSKQFTAIAILLLDHEGKLNLDDPAVKYVSNLPWKTITIRQLLTHTSGVPDYLNVIENFWTNNNDLPYNDEMIDFLAKRSNRLIFTPGTRFAYSNTGYCILASVVEGVTGQLFGDFLDERVFKPLDMNNTFVHSTAINRAYYKDRLVGYDIIGKSASPIPHNKCDGTVGDKGIFSTIDDLYKWDQALNTNIILPKEVVATAFQNGKLKNNREIAYGYGFRIKDTPARSAIYHNGYWRGFRTSLWRLDDSHTIILLNHTNSAAKNQLVASIELIVRQEKIQWEAQQMLQLAENS